MPGTCWAGSHSCAIAGRDTWAASGTTDESTTVPEPVGQQDLKTRAAEGGQEQTSAPARQGLP